MSEKLIPEATMAARVTEKLREDIVSKRIEAGSRITIKEIAELYGVSSMPVREAFRTLEGESLLEINAYRGATVLRIDNGFINDVYGLLRALECLAYETALPSLTAETFATLRQLNGEIRQVSESPVDICRYIDLNSQFHETIMRLAHNKKAVELYHYYHMLIRTLRKSYFPGPARVRVVLQEHDALIAALESGDVYAVKKAVDTHVDNAMRNFLQQYAQEA